MSNIPRLPTEVLMKIATYLPIGERRKWNFVSNLFREINKYFSEKEVKAAIRIQRYWREKGRDILWEKRMKKLAENTWAGLAQNPNVNIVGLIDLEEDTWEGLAPNHPDIDITSMFQFYRLI